MNDDIKQTIDHNRSVIYNLRSKARYRKEYPAIVDLFEKKPDLRKLLLSLLKFARNKNLITYHDRQCFFISTKQINELRGKTTSEVSNHWINYLGAVGFLIKMPQYYNEEEEKGEITRITFKILKDTRTSKPMQLWGIVKYTDRHLGYINDIITELNKQKITPGNISKTVIIGHDLKKLADRQYPQVKHKEAFERKEKEYERFKRALQFEIYENGYTTKRILENNYNINMKMCMKYFKPDFEKHYVYKPPNRAEKDKFCLDYDFKGWIIFEKQKEDTKWI